MLQLRSIPVKSAEEDELEEEAEWIFRHGFSTLTISMQVQTKLPLHVLPSLLVTIPPSTRLASLTLYDSHHHTPHPESTDTPVRDSHMTNFSQSSGKDAILICQKYRYIYTQQF